MNKMKKMLACLSAAAMLCGSAVTMNASAAAYNVHYDVNRDGSVDIGDVMALNQYLSGIYYVTNISQMDVNENMIVDSMYSQCLLAYTIGYTDFTFTYLDVTTD